MSWKPHELQLLWSAWSDEAVARKVNRTPNAVHLQRFKMGYVGCGVVAKCAVHGLCFVHEAVNGIPYTYANGGNLRPVITPAMERDLDKKRNVEIMRKYGVSQDWVRKTRIRLRELRCPAAGAEAAAVASLIPDD